LRPSAIDADPSGAKQLFELAVAEAWIMAFEPTVEAKRSVVTVDGNGFVGFNHCGITAAR
jgi:hypothetical protein